MYEGTKPPDQLGHQASQDTATPQSSAAEHFSSFDNEQSYGDEHGFHYSDHGEYGEVESEGSVNADSEEENHATVYIYEGPVNASLQDPRYAPAVIVSQDRSEVYFALSEGIKSGIWGMRERTFVMVGIKFVTFADGECIVGWCDSSCCQQHGDHVQGIFEQQHYPQRCQADYASIQLTCEWSDRIIDAWGGRQAYEVPCKKQQVQVLMGFFSAPSIFFIQGTP